MITTHTHTHTHFCFIFSQFSLNPLNGNISKSLQDETLSNHSTPQPQEDQLNLLQHSASIAADQDLESGFTTSQPVSTNNAQQQQQFAVEENNSRNTIREYFEQSRYTG